MNGFDTPKSVEKVERPKEAKVNLSDAIIKRRDRLNELQTQLDAYKSVEKVKDRVDVLQVKISFALKMLSSVEEGRQLDVNEESLVKMLESGDEMIKNLTGSLNNLVSSLSAENSNETFSVGFDKEMGERVNKQILEIGYQIDFSEARALVNGGMAYRLKRVDNINNKEVGDLQLVVKDGVLSVSGADDVYVFSQSYKVEDIKNSDEFAELMFRFFKDLKRGKEENPDLIGFNLEATLDIWANNDFEVNGSEFALEKNQVEFFKEGIGYRYNILDKTNGAEDVGEMIVGVKGDKIYISLIEKNTGSSKMIEEFAKTDLLGEHKIISTGHDLLKKFAKKLAEKKANAPIVTNGHTPLGPEAI